MTGVAGGQRGVVAMFAPLDDKLPGNRIALERRDSRDVGDCGQTQGHRDSNIVTMAPFENFVTPW